MAGFLAYLGALVLLAAVILGVITIGLAALTVLIRRFRRARR
ncbi:MAG TPA: hypothetical protein VGQ48_01550 [Gemmatimonadales bacterium]|nr:hypothetical protein [Gemmatimonadales bacterium]